MNQKSLSIIGFFILVLSIVALLTRGTLVAGNAILIGVQGAAVLLMIWARLTFGRRSFHAAATPTEGGLITSGPYKFIRHPIYAAILYFIWAGVITHLSIVDIVLVFIGTLGVAIRVYAEERLIIVRYPEYAEYAKRTKRVIPFLL
jgi:protein-S-isoprenylcysteine O-methyltransferase Ste14